jgi:hypothetical protein
MSTEYTPHRVCEHGSRLYFWRRALRESEGLWYVVFCGCGVLLLVSLGAILAQHEFWRIVPY